MIASPGPLTVRVELEETKFYNVEWVDMLARRIDPPHGAKLYDFKCDFTGVAIVLQYEQASEFRHTELDAYCVRLMAEYRSLFQ